MQFHIYATDLLILPENREEKVALYKWAREQKISGTVNFVPQISNVLGQDWYGKTFYELPFASHRQEEINDYVQAELEAKHV